MKTTEIINPPKSWWEGDARVEKFMLPVRTAIAKHVKEYSPEYTHIYNKAYEAVYYAIKEYSDGKVYKEQPEVTK